MNPTIIEQLNSIPDDYTQEHLKRTIRLMDPSHVRQIRTIIEKFTSIIPEQLSTTQKAAILYEVITRRTQYSDIAGCESQYVFVSALLSQKAVCMGIAELYSILCTWMEIPNKLIIGYAWNGFDTNNGSLHAWNLVKLSLNKSETWFHCDPTWDLVMVNHSSHRFFLKSDSYMKENKHIWIDKKYPHCAENYPYSIKLNEEGVQLTCRILNNVIASTLKTRQ